ncbi:hypothetical protein GCM10010129_76520 [Streptomyces fumigatiscleroticus]|nr:hypothetical protein GCM10010129_76520 [Streptomyces fumigatiscleroticus]
MAAGARLKKMRRRVRLPRLALLTAIAAGSVALGVAVLSGPTTVAAAPTPHPAEVRTSVAADSSGYAQLFAGAWLRSHTDDASNRRTLGVGGPCSPNWAATSRSSPRAGRAYT